MYAGNCHRHPEFYQSDRWCGPSRRRAFLRRSGADITRVRKLFRENMVDYQAKAEAVKNAQVYMDAFAISICPSEGLESPTIVGAQAANELLEIRGIKASVVLTMYNNVVYYQRPFH